MNFLSMGTVSSYANTLKLQMKWQQKQNEPAPIGGRNADMYAAQIKGIQEANKKANVYLIESKLKAGVPLTGSDMETLKKEAPELYKKAVEVAKLRERYKEELAACKSKEDVERLRSRYMSAFSAEAKSIMQSSIPPDKKLEKMDFLQMKLAATADEHASFVQSEEYARLPSENGEDEKEAREKKRLRAKAESEELRLPRQPAAEGAAGQKTQDPAAAKGEEEERAEKEPGGKAEGEKVPAGGEPGIGGTRGADALQTAPQTAAAAEVAPEAGMGTASAGNASAPKAPAPGYTAGGGKAAPHPASGTKISVSA